MIKEKSTMFMNFKDKWRKCNNGEYFVPEILLTSYENKILDFEKFKAEGPRIWKTFEITRTIYSNGERSEQFLVKECFLNLFLEVSHI